MALVQKCLVADYDSATQTCTNAYWEAESTVIPALSIEGAQEIGASVALLWAIAWGFRRIRKALETIG